MQQSLIELLKIPFRIYYTTKQRLRTKSEVHFSVKKSKFTTKTKDRFPERPNDAQEQIK